MGNTLHAAFGPNKTLVRVYHGDSGQLMQFSSPISAAKLMQQHPNYLLVYTVVGMRQAFFADRRVLRKRVHIRLVRPGDYLQTGRGPYFLVHILDQYRPRFTRLFDLSRRSVSAAASPRSKCRSPSASPLYSPTTSPLCSPIWSPLTSPLPAPLPNRRLSGSIRETKRVATPLSTHIPKRFKDSSTREPTRVATPQISSRMYFSTRETTRVATSQSAQIPTRMNGSTREPTRVATPQSAHIPTRMNGTNRETTRVATPQVTHIPTRMNGSTREPTRVATPQLAHIPTRMNGTNRETTRVATPQVTHIPTRMNGSTREPTRVATPQSAHIPTRMNGSNRETTRVATPQVTHILTRMNGSTRETTRVATPLPTQTPILMNVSTRETTRVATPLPAQIPICMNGRTREATRVVNQMHAQRNPAHSNRIQSPGGPGTPRKHATLRSIINQNGVQEVPTGTPTRSMKRSGRVAPLPTQDTVRNVVHRNSPQRNSTTTLTGSPGSAFATVSQVTARGSFNQRPKGKVIVSEEPVNAPFLPRRDSGESKTTTKSRGATPAPAPASAPVPAPGDKISSGVNTHLPRLTRSCRLRRSLYWAPGLGSISENSASTSDVSVGVDELIARRYNLLKRPARSDLLRRAR